jgi:hypothetical protein
VVFSDQIDITGYGANHLIEPDQSCLQRHAEMVVLNQCRAYRLL